MAKDKGDDKEQQSLDFGLVPITQKDLIKEGFFLAPKVILASALFTTRNTNQPRTHFDGMPILVAPGLGRINYKGEELRYNDMEVWRGIIELGGEREIHKTNHIIKIPSYQFLKRLGWGTSGREYGMLNECLLRLKANALSVVAETGNAIKAVSLIAKFYNNPPNDLEITLDPEIYKLFQSHITLLNSTDLRNMPKLARKIYEVFMSEPTENLTVAMYMGLSGNNYKHVRQFKPKLIAALKQLAAGGFIDSWHINDSNIVFINSLNLELPLSNT